MGYRNSPSSTFVFHLPFGNFLIATASPLIVQHILKNRFDIYEKGNFFRTTNSDLLGHGILNTDGENWKFQRQLSSLEFNTKSLQKFVNMWWMLSSLTTFFPSSPPLLKKGTILDFEDILQRLAAAFDEAVKLSGQRAGIFFPSLWKIKRLLSIGCERKLRLAVKEIRDFAKQVIQQKMQDLGNQSSEETSDLLSRFLSSSHADENFLTDIVISFMLAGRDSTSAALTWFFWLLSKNPRIESEILKEIKEKSDVSVYDELKEMVYTHAGITDSMRLYPPIPYDFKEAIKDDVLPDGNVVKKGTRVVYHVYAMGRMEELWGEDWAEFRPERWLEKDDAAAAGNLRFVGRDAYTYPVFQAGPRICLGKEMAYLQMKRVIAGVLSRFQVVPVVEDGVEPGFVPSLTSKMKGGFPVKIVERN